MSIESKLAELEARIVALEEGPIGAPPPVVIGPPPSNPFYFNGMSSPDSLGRVKLQRVEGVRPSLSANLASVNASIPEYFYVYEAITTFAGLNESQKALIQMNTGFNAHPLYGHAGRCFDLAGNVIENTHGCIARDGDDAAAEVIKLYSELYTGAIDPAGVEF